MDIIINDKTNTATLKMGIASQPAVNLDLLIHALTNNIPETGMLPLGTRYVSNDHTKIVVEIPPFLLSTHYRVDDNQGNHYMVHDINIPIPWTTIFVNFGAELATVDTVFLYVRNRAMLSSEDQLCTMPYPNVYSDNKVCLGDQLVSNYAEWYKSLVTKPTLSQAYFYLQGIFWSSDMNNEVPAWLSPWRLPPELGQHHSSYIDGLTGNPGTDSLKGLHILQVYSLHNLTGICSNFTFTPIASFKDILNEFIESTPNTNTSWGVLMEAYKKSIDEQITLNTSIENQDQVSSSSLVDETSASPTSNTGYYPIPASNSDYYASMDTFDLDDVF